MRNIEIRPLSKGDDRSRFHSGSEPLDEFFHKFAGQNQFKYNIGVTYVAMVDSRIVGYATVTAGVIEPDNEGGPNYQRPILRLARMAVDASIQSVGVGTSLLRHVFHLAAQMVEALGCTGVAVDAKHEAVDYYARFGFAPFRKRDATSASSNTTLMFLPIKTIVAAMTADTETDGETPVVPTREAAVGPLLRLVAPER